MSQKSFSPENSRSVIESIQPTLRVGIIQTNLSTQTADEIYCFTEQELKKVDRALDVIVLPEMFTAVHLPDCRQLAEKPAGQTAQWMLRIARQLNALVCGSVSTKENGHFYNRFYFAYPDGKLEWYDKKNLYPLGGEFKTFTAGTKNLNVHFRGWRLAAQVCFDMCRTGTCGNPNDFDVLVYAACWPEELNEAWTTLLCGRAIENQAYALLANRMGTDATGPRYAGRSSAFTPSGELLGTLEPKTAGLLTAELSHSALENYRSKYPFLPIRDV